MHFMLLIDLVNLKNIKPDKNDKTTINLRYKYISPISFGLLK